MASLFQTRRNSNDSGISASDCACQVGQFLIVPKLSVLRSLKCVNGSQACPPRLRSFNYKTNDQNFPVTQCFNASVNFSPASS